MTHFYHAHTDACDPVCVLTQLKWGFLETAPPPLLPDDDTSVERLAARDHEWSQANGRVHCGAFYVPARPCTPKDHREWAEAIVAALRREVGE